MSIVDVEKVDGIGLDNNEKDIVLLITDHLDWLNEYEHLMQLQNKINSYISFIESEQYAEIYPNYQFTSIRIEIHFRYEPTHNCINFIDVVNKQLNEKKIVIKCIMANQ